MREEAQKVDGKGVKAIVKEALQEYGGPFRLSESYNGTNPAVLCLLLDAHW